MSTSDSIFHTLPALLQSKIDNAFTAALQNPQVSKEATTNVGGFTLEDGGGFLVDDPAPSTGGGGFVVDDPPQPGGGGFLIENDDDENNTPSQIPISLVPSALQLLDLPPDDPEVLSVFQNAAGGWRSSDLNPSEPYNAEGGWVSRDDFRAVCAVLMEGHDEDDDNASNEDEDVHMSSPSISSPSASDSDEYQQSQRRKPVRRTRSAAATSSPLGSAPANSKPTPRQRKTALDAFALFFPDLGEEDNLAAQRIRVSEIQRTADVLKEKIKAEEMVEMLSMFSTAPDKSMGLEDFTRMMIAAKLA
ncbi:hypothetical protein BDN70DRAFT_811626 [Pholiota conissans]|uniref:Uncharacterized protein n=1 Tax=Pholiota conissans TaxID=109636 RepID=A0A9P5YZP3_9AGAR|nr:hypothetical protein BDN70DRAFT_811626 [Pholiota conissans]